MSAVEQLPIGVCSWSLQVRGVAELSDCLRRLGLDYVQIGCGDAKPQAARVTGAMLAFPGEDYTTLQTIKATGGFGPTERRVERIELLKWGLQRTKELGVQDLSFHAGFIPPSGSSERRPFLDVLADVGALAGDAGVFVGFETGQEPAELLKLTLDELDNPHLKINFDPANMLLYDMGDPLQAIELLGPYVRRVHAKDACRPSIPGSWGSEVPLGQGEVNMTAFVRALWRAGYRGPLCIEREVGSQQQRFDDIAHGINVLKAAICAIDD